MQKVAVVQGLQTQVVKLQVAVSLERGAQTLQVELEQAPVQQLVVYAALDELGEVVHVSLAHVGRRDVFAQNFFGNGVKQQARRGVGVVGVFFNQGACRQHRGFVHLVHGNAVVQVAHGLGHDWSGLDIGTQTGAGGLNQASQPVQVEHDALSVVQRMQLRRGSGVLHCLFGALLGALFPVEHVGARDLVVATAHQAELNLVLHIFYVERATAGARTHHCADDGLRQHIDHFPYAGRGCALGAVHGQKRFHHCNCNLVGLKRNHSAVAADDLVLAQRMGHCVVRVARTLVRACAAGTGSGIV